MSKTYKDLTDQQRKNHEAALERVGINRASVTKKMVIDKPTTLHRDAARSHVKAHTITVHDVAHMKELGGVPDSRFTEEKHPDSHITYPKPLAGDRQRVLARAGVGDSLHAVLQPEEHSAIDSAVRAYVLGNSTKVPTELVALANAANFPMEASVVAADDLEVRDKMVITGPPNPYKLIAGTITIYKPLGQIVAEGVDLSIEAQHIVVVPADK